MRILVCEDQDAIRKMMETLIGATGHSVVAVETGEKAVERALNEKFDVLLLDLMLPGAIDGFGVCSRLRAQKATETMPIFVISAMDDPESKARARECGASAFYSKPFSPFGLLKDIDALSPSPASRRHV
jgi:DNA-binding response OmpR family regulator